MTQTRTPIFPTDDLGDYGPAMKALRGRQRAFVISMLETGKNDNSFHARNAGYEGNDQTIWATAYRLAHDPKVQAAIHEEAERRLKGSAIIATSTVVGLLTSVDEKIQLRAAEMIFNRVGLHATTEHKVTVEHVEDDKTLLDKARRLAGELGIDISKMVGHSHETPLQIAAPVIEGEFAELTAEKIADDEAHSQWEQEALAHDAESGAMLSYEESLAQVEDI